MDIVGIIPKSKREGKVINILTAVGMETHKDKMPSSLSGDEQQRVAIARSLANNATVIFANKPTGNLNSENAIKIFQLLKTLNEQGKTIVMVTHERKDIPDVTRKIILKDGQIVVDYPIFLQQRFNTISSQIYIVNFPNILLQFALTTTPSVPVSGRDASVLGLSIMALWVKAEKT